MVPSGDTERLFDWARRHGLALFPIPAWSKRPGGIVASHAEDWSLDPAQWRAWWDRTGGCNFGVECGPSRLIVVDVDADDAGVPYFDAFWASRVQHGEMSARTPSGGWHVYCRAPDGVRLRQRAWQRGRIDTRAGRGYVVAPWCATRSSADPQASDGSYVLVGAGPPQDAPPELLARCADVPEDEPDAPPPPVADFADDGFSVDPLERARARTRFEGLVSALRSAPVGSRNAELNEAAFAVGKMVAAGAVEPRWAEAALCAEGAAIGLDRDEIRPTVRSGVGAGLRSGPADALRTAVGALLARAVPLGHPAAPYPLAVSAGPAGDFPEPVVERLLYEGCVTVLSGRGGTGKTTVAASLMASSAADLRDFVAPRFAADSSDVLVRPASWVLVSYEGGQYVDLHRRAWHEGTGSAETRAGRCRVIARRGPLVYLRRREAEVDQVHAEQILAAVAEARASEPGLPVAVAVDNVTSAVEDSTDAVQAGIFMRAMRALADQGAAVLVFAHPPKRGDSPIYGAQQLHSLADVVGELEVLRRDEEWTQWVSFDKHRVAPNGLCLELMSRRLERPLIELPPGWGAGNERARERATRDLRTPFIWRVRVRPESEREAAKGGVRRVDAVTAKPVAEFPARPPEEPRGPPPPGTLIPFRSKPRE